MANAWFVSGWFRDDSTGGTVTYEIDADQILVSVSEDSVSVTISDDSILVEVT